MNQNSGNDQVPSWDGDPNTFKPFATNCRWYSYGLKTSARSLAAPRVRQNLRNLHPEQYAGAKRLEKLLQVLLKSPVQRPPIPDTFQRLESWTKLNRRQQESIPQLLVREKKTVHRTLTESSSCTLWRRRREGGSPQRGEFRDRRGGQGANSLRKHLVDGRCLSKEGRCFIRRKGEGDDAS